jgi:hypothetical protein
MMTMKEGVQVVQAAQVAREMSNILMKVRGV